VKSYAGYIYAYDMEESLASLQIRQEEF